MVQDFKLFRVLDTVTFLGVNSIPTIALIYACLHGLASNGQALALMIIVVAAFWGIYGLFLYKRQQFLNKITFITKHQIAVMANGFDVKQADVEAETDEMITKWDAACNFNKSADSLVGLWVSFATFPIEDRRAIGHLAGFLLGNNCVIGWKSDLKITAFQHELGHCVHHKFTGVWDNSGCHNFMAAHNLP